jgi:hypothetical protein
MSARSTRGLEEKWRRFCERGRVNVVDAEVVELLLPRLVGRASVTPIMFSAHWTVAVLDAKGEHVRKQNDNDFDRVRIRRSIAWDTVENRCEDYAAFLFDEQFAQAVEEERCVEA